MQLDEKYIVYSNFYDCFGKKKTIKIKININKKIYKNREFFALLVAILCILRF
jgi:hypothetical protein